MLSQVRRRLLHHTLPGGTFLDSTVNFPSLAQYSSKKDDDEGPKFSAGISQPVKNQPRSTRVNTHKDVFDELNELFPAKPITARKVTFKNKVQQEPGNHQLKRMKPGQLNIKMVEAAKTVASHAGQAKDKVFDDLLRKLDDVFPGMEHHHGKDKRKREKEKSAGFVKEDVNLKRGEADDELAILSEVIRQESSGRYDGNQSKLWSPGEDMEKSTGFVKEDVNMKRRGADDELAIVSEVIGQNPGGRKFDAVSALSTFSSVEELLKCKSPEGLLSPNGESIADPSLKLWESFEEMEIRRVTRYEPLNWFDQCIVWTEQGKLWQFPINNEQGMDEEAKIDFTEHIFLDNHIESWCPKEGPIRHFMELVLVGLSKNAFLTVKDKKETIAWYHQYFMKNSALLEEINALGSAQKPITVEGNMN